MKARNFWGRNQENGRPLAFLAAAQMSGIVLDSAAVTHLFEHLQVVLISS
jgi:hypothetical protein